MKGFINRRAGVLLSVILAFNSFGIWAYASDTDSDEIAFEEEISISEDSWTEDEDEFNPDETYDSSDIWVEDPADETAWDSFDESTDIFEEDEPGSEEFVADDDEFSAKKTENSAEDSATEYFTVRYESDEYGITDLPVDNNHYRKGDMVMISYAEPVRTGYSFWGWSFTGDSSCVYTGGYTFEITEDVTLYAAWALDEYFYEDELLSSEELANAADNPIINAINSYVNSLKGRFNPVFKYKGKVKSIQCCAFTDQIWKNALGIGRYSTPSNYKIIDSRKKLKKSEIYDFLKENNAQPGDIIWCHDPVSASKYNITHYMILMGYDKKGITITDGYERNGKGIIWKNNQRVSYTGDHAKYFSGKCYVRIYHVTKTN